MTVWPAALLTPVEVERWVFSVDAAVESGQLEWNGQQDARPLPEEWVLRELADADLDADEQVARLLEDYGVISWAFFDRAHVPEDRWPLLAEAPAADERSSDDWWKKVPGTLEDARWWLKAARALARIWAEANAGGDPAGVWVAEGFAFLHPEDCWPQFAMALNIGLEAFRARVEHRKDYGSGVTVNFGRPRVGLYSAACAQVFNFAAGAETARRCENETCRRAFVHQRSDIEYRQHHRSIGLRFCTDKCARAQASRQYRRRKAVRAQEQT